MPLGFPQSRHTLRALWAPVLSSSSHFWPDTFEAGDPLQFLPHTHEAGDSYYIGDVYEPSRIGQSGEIIEEHLLEFKPRAP